MEARTSELLAFVLEREAHFGSVDAFLPVDVHVELNDLRDSQVSKGLCRPINRRVCRHFPRLAARPDELDDLINALWHRFLAFYVPATSLDHLTRARHIALLAAVGSEVAAKINPARGRTGALSSSRSRSGRSRSLRQLPQLGADSKHIRRLEVVEQYHRDLLLRIKAVGRLVAVDTAPTVHV